MRTPIQVNYISVERLTEYLSNGRMWMEDDTTWQQFQRDLLANGVTVEQPTSLGNTIWRHYAVSRGTLDAAIAAL